MKNKWIALAAVVLLLLLTPAAYSVVETNTLYRYHQHIESPKPVSACEKERQSLCTHLPIISISADWLPDANRDTEEATVPCEVKFLDSGGYNHPTDTPTAQSAAAFHVRGNSSRHFDKPSYKLNLKKEDGSENKEISVLGMPAHDEWVLHGPFMDRTLIRNYLCYNIAGEIREDTPEVRFFELVLNGEYQGLYLAVESVAVSSDRVNLLKYKEGDSTFSYLVQADRSGKNPAELDDFLRYGFFRSNEISRAIEYPSPEKLTEAQKRFIETDLSEIEKALYTYDYNDPLYGYKATLEASSFMDYYIINDFFGNNDAGLFSTFFYKDRRGKLNIGPVWDFNNAIGNYAQDSIGKKAFALTGRPFYTMLFRDPDFTERVISRYKVLRGQQLSDAYLSRYIDDTVAYLGNAVDRNYARWEHQFDLEKMDPDTMLQPMARNPKSYDEAVAQMKNTLLEHGKWLDENIDSLRQLSHASANKRYKH